MRFLLIAVILLCSSTANAAEPKSDYFVVKFGASWCGPCKQMDPHWEHPDVKKELKKYRNFVDNDGKVYKIDTDRDREWTIKYKVTALPTIIIMDRKGKVVRRAIGYMTRVQLKNWLAKDIESRAGPAAQQEEVVVYGAVTILKWVVILLAKLALFFLT